MVITALAGSFARIDEALEIMLPMLCAEFTRCNLPTVSYCAHATLSVDGVPSLKSINQ